MFNFFKAASERSKDSQTALPEEKNGTLDVGNDKWKALLSPMEYAVLREGQTDPPRSHKYDDFFEPDGVYNCAACDTPLYTSEMKFDCGCGWPGFWTCLPKAVREQPDSDGQRIEIVCNACNAHLGHVFRGEKFKNPLNERHCVNGTSLKFLKSALTKGK